MFRLPIRITLMSLLLVISLISTFLMFFVQKHFSEDLSKTSISKEFNNTSKKVEHNIKDNHNINNTVINSSTTFLENLEYKEFVENENKYLKVFKNILEDNKSLYAVYIGFSDNNFYELINLSINTKLQKQYKAKKSDLWLEVKINKNLEKTLKFYNKDLVKTFEKKEYTDFIVKKRPWYKKAIKTNKIVKSGPYIFSSIKSRGITYSKNLNNKNVFSIDILLNDFSKTLKNSSNYNTYETFLFDEKKYIIAKQSKSNKIFNQIVKKFEDNIDSTINHHLIIVDNTEYIYNISTIKQYDKKEYLLSYVSLKEIMFDYEKKFSQMNTIFIILFIVFIPIFWLLSSIIIRPILQLAFESKKIGNREFSKIKLVKTRIKEIDLLSNSINKMADSTNKYQNDLKKEINKKDNEINFLKE